MGTNWSNLEVDNLKPISYFDVPIDEEIKAALNWIFSQILLKEVHQFKKIVSSILDCRLSKLINSSD